MSFVLSEFPLESTSYCIVRARHRHLDTEVGIMTGEYHYQHSHHQHDHHHHHHRQRHHLDTEVWLVVRDDVEPHQCWRLLKLKGDDERRLRWELFYLVFNLINLI